MANVIDSFLIAIGFKVDPGGAAALKKQTDDAKSQLFSLGTAVKTFLTGYVVKGIAEVNSTFEQNRIQIAGFLDALDLSPNFNQGLQDASDIIAQINKDAARLPGEAEEYVEVFKTNAAYLKTGIPGADAGQIAAFTNRLTAVAKTVASTMDAGQIGRESGMLLATEGRAGSHNVLWTKLLPILMQVDGQAKITAQSFNAMTQPQRVELLNKAFDKLQPAIDAASDSFDAMWGAAVSGVKQFVRSATPGVFKAMKEGLQTVTGFFINDAGKLTANGAAIADVLQRVGYGITRMIRLGGIAAKALGKFAAGSLASKMAILGLVSAIIGFQKVLRFGLLGAILLIIEDLQTFEEGGKSVTGMLAERFPQAVEIMKVALFALIGVFTAVQTKAIGSAIATAAAWAVANAPFLIILATIGAIVYVFTHWSQVIDEVGDKLRNIGQAFAAFQRGDLGALGYFSNKSIGLDKSTKYGAGFKQLATGGIFGAGAQGAAVGEQNSLRRQWDASGGMMSSVPSAPNWVVRDGGAPEPKQYAGPTQNPVVTSNTTINVNGAGDPRAVAAEVVKVQERQNRGAIRRSQKAHGY